jgi:hypothetical protein
MDPTGVSGASAIVSQFWASPGCGLSRSTCQRRDRRYARSDSGLKSADSPLIVGVPLATRMTLTASPMTSARRHSPLGPRGVDILIGCNKGVNLGENVLMEPPLSLG